MEKITLTLTQSEISTLVIALRDSRDITEQALVQDYDPWESNHEEYRNVMEDAITGIDALVDKLMHYV